MTFSVTKKSVSSGGPLAIASQQLRTQANSSTLVLKEHTQAVLSMESADVNTVHSVNMAGQGLESLISSMVDAFGLDKKSVTVAMESAATYGGLLAGDTTAVGRREFNFNQVSSDFFQVSNQGMSGGFTKMTLAQEAFNEVDNRTALAYSVMFNFLSARQDEVTETFWPTIVLSPDQVGIEVHVNVMTVFDGHQHKITGAFEDFNRKNLVRAVADSTILNKDATNVVPVYRPGSEDMFVDTAIVPDWVELVDGIPVPTAALAFNKKIGILGLAQPDYLLKTGESDQRDSLDPTFNLKKIFFQVGSDVLSFNVRNLPYSNFVAGMQNDRQVQPLNFPTKSLLINETKKNVDGSDLVDLASIVTGKLAVRLETTIAGSVNIETGELNVFPGELSVFSVTDEDGTILGATDARVVAIVTALKTAKWLGYQIEGFRTNANRRQRGQLINTRRFTQLYNCPWRTPIAVERPAHKGAEDDASDLQALITTTRIRIGNEAITAILDTARTLGEYYDAKDSLGVGPDVEGLGRFYVLPTFVKKTIDLATIVNSLTSSARAEDIQAALVVTLRDAASRMYTDSQYKAASDSLTGGTAPTPKVILLTDPIIARYLLAPGDLRTLGSQFELKVVETLDYRIRGKIFMAFTAQGESATNEVNILNFGNLFWSPELVLAANMTRTGGYNKETQVQPRYLFVNHCPVMAEFDVTGIPEVISKVPMDVKVLP